MVLIRVLCGSECTWSREFDQDEVRIARDANTHVPLPAATVGGQDAPIEARVIRRPERPDLWFLRIEQPGGANLLVAGEMKPTDVGVHVPIQGEVDLVLGPGQVTIRIQQSGTAEAPRALSPPPVIQKLARVLATARRRAGLLALLGIMLTTVVVVLLGQQRRMKERLSALESRPQDATPAADERLQLDLDEAKDSTFLVAIGNAVGDVSALATAWAVTEDQLATNAHVAEALKSVEKDGEQPIVRRPGNPPVDLPVEAVQIHPAYERWHKVFEKSLPRIGAAGFEPLRLVPPADVALLKVAGKLKPLPLSADHDLLRLSAGTPVGYVGFPTENLPGPRINAPATAVQGRLTATTDSFLQETEPRGNLLLHHDLPITGGASGSPLIDSSGHVVGLVSASGFVHTTGGWVPIGLGFAHRVDLVREILDGTANQKQPLRDSEWFSALEDLTGTPRQRIELSARMQLRRMIEAESLAPQATSSVISEFRAPLQSGESLATEHRLFLDGPGKFGILAAANDWSDVDLVVTEGQQALGEDRLPDGLPAVWLTIEESKEIVLKVFAEAVNLPHLPPDATVLAFRVTEGSE